MLQYRLTNTLSFTQESEWQYLIESTLGSGVHPGRAHGFRLAREALLTCLADLNIQLGVGQVILDRYDLLRGHEFLTLSLSHTPSYGAAVIGDRKEYQALGIDIESVDRVVKPMILERISHAQDCSLPPIHLWALKEACFKALMNTQKFSRPEEFSSIQVLDKKWIHSPSGIEGEWKLDIENKMVVALAWIRT